MAKRQDRVSVVILAYNEETNIANCLKAVSTQTIAPYEIIVVNNNSTDKTVDIVKRFKGVKIIDEKHQGMSFARTRGFNYATGDILVRLDADTILPPDWVEKVLAEFTDDPSLDGLTCYGETRIGVGAPKALWPILSRFWSWVYFTHCKAFFGVNVLWGANLVIKRPMWQKIKKLCLTSDDYIHEDQDLSLALASIGGKIKIVSSLSVSIDFYETEHLGKFWRYNMMKRHTRKLHYQHPRSRLKTFKKIGWPKRLWCYSLTVPFDVVYTLYTAINSFCRVVAKNFRRLFDN